MSEWETERLALPLLAAAQAQKEWVHNEALSRIDIAAQCVVESADLSVPPAAPVLGACWIVPAGASGAWAGQAGAIAGWTSGGWRFVAPRTGFHAWVRDRGHGLRHDGANWQDDAVRADGLFIGGQQVVGVRQPGVAAAAGGTIVDVQARDAIAAILAAMRAHGLISLDE